MVPSAKLSLEPCGDVFSLMPERASGLKHFDPGNSEGITTLTIIIEPNIRLLEKESQ